MEKLRQRLSASVIIILGIVLVVGIFTFQAFFTIVDAGTVGVQSTFGSVSDDVFQPGFHLKNPFTQVVTMSTRTASYTMSSSYAEGEVQGDDSIQALAKDGGLVWFDVTVLYKLDPDSAPEVYRSLGVGYEENIVRPNIRSAIREVAAEYPVNELYSSKREEAADRIFEKLEEDVDGRGIIVEDVLVRKVNISESLSDSIEQKLAAEQQVQQQEFEIQKTEKEAERKVIEARGQRDAQKIIAQSLSERYLNYLYITNLQSREGTIYIPLDPDNGLPLFRNIE